jgi:hypothetical protein
MLEDLHLIDEPLLSVVPSVILGGGGGGMRVTGGGRGRQAGSTMV